MSAQDPGDINVDDLDIGGDAGGSVDADVGADEPSQPPGAGPETISDDKDSGPSQPPGAGPETIVDGDGGGGGPSQPPGAGPETVVDGGGSGGGTARQPPGGGPETIEDPAPPADGVEQEPGFDRGQPPGAGPETVEDPDPAQGVEIAGSGVAIEARRFEKRVEEQTGLESEDIRIRQEGDRLIAELTTTGQAVFAARRRGAIGGLLADPAGVDRGPVVSAPAGGFAGVRGGTPRGADVLGVPDSQPTTGAPRETTGASVETETIGAAGPLGVTVPVEREPALSGQDIINALSRPTPDAPGPSVLSGQGQDVPRGLPEDIFGALTRQPGGAPGVGVMAGQPGAREDFAAFLDQLTAPVTGEPTEAVPEGAPGPGVTPGGGPQLAADAAAFERLVRQNIERPLAGLGEEPDTAAPPANARDVVGAPGPLGVSAPSDQLTPGEIAEAVEAFGRRLDEPVTGEPTETVPEGAPGAGVLPGQPGADPLGDIRTLAETGAQNVRIPTDFEPGVAPGRLETQRGLFRPEPAEPFRGTPLAEAIIEDIETTVVTEGEAAELPEREEQFGDFDPVVGGVAVEPTLRRASAGFRDVTGGAAEETTDFLGLEEGSFADVAVETGVRTFPEIFNVPGAAVETLEIAELGAFVAADPGERGPLVAEAGVEAAEETVEFFQERPAAGVGLGAAVAIQLPLSLLTLRGLGAVSPTLARAQDVVWNTPERVGRRLAGLEDRPLFQEFGELPGFETRTAAFGGGEGPGAMTELRFAGRTIGATEAEIETGEARRRIELAEEQLMDPTAAEIETEAEFEFAPLPELETAIAAELGIGGLSVDEPETDVLQAQDTEPLALVDTRPLAVSGVETQLGIETELGIEQEAELEVEQEVETEPEPELELEMEQEQEAEPELELEMEPEMEPEAELFDDLDLFADGAGESPLLEAFGVGRVTEFGTLREALGINNGFDAPDAETAEQILGGPSTPSGFEPMPFQGDQMLDLGAPSVTGLEGPAAVPPGGALPASVSNALFDERENGPLF